MNDQFAIFTLGIIVGMSIIEFVNLFLKIREEDMRWKKEWESTDKEQTNENTQ